MIINIVGDVTGFANTLKALYNKLPEGQFWGVGDLIDRGPDSKGVLDFFIDGSHNSVMGNHDHMMLYEKIKNNLEVQRNLYHPKDWPNNGGNSFAKSFGLNGLGDFYWADYEKYYGFVEKMPLVMNEGRLQITHAPLNDKINKKILDLKEINRNAHLLHKSVLWGRLPPTEQKGQLQVYGHNSTNGILWHTKQNPLGVYMENPLEIPDGVWGVCVDTWREGYLTALTIDTDLLDNPSQAIKITQQTIIDPGDWQPKPVLKNHKRDCLNDEE